MRLITEYFLSFLFFTTNNMAAWGINCDVKKLTKWACTMDVYETVQVNPKNQDLQSFSVDLFAWLTMFIGFVVFVAIVYSWFLMITGWADEKQFENWKKWVIYSSIWLVLVGWAYAIIKIIQNVAA